MKNSSDNSSKNLRAIVLAAGFGKRMRSDTAKVMHSVLGQPMIWRILQTLNQLGNISKDIATGDRTVTKQKSGQQVNLESENPPDKDNVRDNIDITDRELEQIHIVLGHQIEQVEKGIEKYKHEFKPNTSISTHKQEPQLGTGHAVMSVRSALDNFQGNILVLPGDCPLLSNTIINSLIDMHMKERATLSFLTATLDNPTGYGRVIRSSQGQIQAIVEEKDASEKEKQIREINTSIYCFNWPLIAKGFDDLKNNNKQGEYYLTDLVAWTARHGHKIANVLVDDWRLIMGVNSKVDLACVNKLLNETALNKLALEEGVTIIDPSSTWIAPEVNIGQDTVILPGCWLVGDISIGQSCTIGPHTSIEGKVKIGSQTKIIQSHLEDCQVGDNCLIGPFAHLRTGTILDNEVRIGNFVELKMSTVGSQTNISHLSYVGDTTLGRQANIGAGTITANYDHITKVKAATVIEDGAAIGSNAVLIAPVKVGKDSVVAAGTIVTKDIESGALAVGRTKQENIPGWTAKRKEKKLKTKNN